VAFTISSNNIDEVSTQPLTTKTDEEKIFEGHPNDLLPRLAELSETWSLRDKGEKTGIESNDGLQIVYGKTYLNIGIFSGTQLGMSIFKFDSPENSKLHYEDRFSREVERGSKITETQKDGAECFGIYRTSGTLERASLQCTNHNIFISIDTASNELDAKRTVNEFMGIALDKIN